jgi:hypothetical protein
MECIDVQNRTVYNMREIGAPLGRTLYLANMPANGLDVLIIECTRYFGKCLQSPIVEANIRLSFFEDVLESDLPMGPISLFQLEPGILHGKGHFNRDGCLVKLPWVLDTLPMDGPR